MNKFKIEIYNDILVSIVLDSYGKLFLTKEFCMDANAI